MLASRLCVLPIRKPRIPFAARFLSSKPSSVDIPVVDLQSPRASIVKSIREACTNVGFLYIVNHSVSDRLVARTFEESRKFFELPQAEKNRSAANKYNRGYTPFFEEVTNPSNQKMGDTKEGFYIGREVAEGSEENIKLPLHGPNVWPNPILLSGWRETMMEYHAALSVLGARMVSYIAEGLGLRHDYFASRFDKPVAILRLIHYNQQLSNPSAGVFGTGEHTDYGMLTLLATDTTPGLQIFYKDNWIDVPYKKGAFIVNLGDMLQRWTNDLFSSTNHRVINTHGKERYSLAFFYEPNYETVVESLIPGESPKYPPVVSGEYLLQKYSQTHSLYKAG